MLKLKTNKNIIMLKKYIILIACFILLVFIFLKLNETPMVFEEKVEENELESNKKPTVSEEKIEENEKVFSVAACPTFHSKVDELKKSKKINIIKTNSTAESLKLIGSKEVDLIISGRALKKEEPKLLFEKIGPGYDFIFDKELVIFEKEMQFVPFYTDLNLEKIINDFKYISENNLTKIEEPKNYLNKGVVISFLNDYLIGESVHILNEDKSRVYLSRLPRLYYQPDFPKDVIIEIKEILSY